MKILKVKEPMFGGGVNIIISTEQEFCDLINKKYVKYGASKLVPDDSLGGFHRDHKVKIPSTDKSFHNYIWLKEFSWELDNMNILFHEIEHYIIQDLTRRCIYLHYENEIAHDEPFTYFAGVVQSRIVLALLKEYPVK